MDIYRFPFIMEFGFEIVFLKQQFVWALQFHHAMEIEKYYVCILNTNLLQYLLFFVFVSGSLSF